MERLKNKEQLTPGGKFYDKNPRKPTTSVVG